MYKFSLIVLLVILSVTAVQSEAKALENSVIDWNLVQPEEVEMDSTLLDDLEEVEVSFPNINSLLVLRNGKLVFEKYYNGHNEESLFEICSATKTITSALVGIAIDKGYIEGVDEKIVGYFPEYKEEIIDPKFREITIKDIITMTDGIDWYDNSSDFLEVMRRNPIKYFFGLSCVSFGNNSVRYRFNYNSLDSHVLSGIITKTTGMNEKEFAEKYLFGPLEIEEFIWPADLQGNSTGAYRLHLRTRDMAKIGQLYLNEGKWNGKQIISSEWIKNSTREYSVGGPPHGEKYGYHVWITEVHGYPAYFAGGYGGQFIYVVPELELVVAITSTYDCHREGHRDVIGYYIVPAINN